MRVVVLFVSLLLLSACKDEPDFDTRYEKATGEIEARAKAMDADIAKSAEADAAASKDLHAAAKPSNAPMSSGE